MKVIIASDFHIKFKETPEDLERRLQIEFFLRGLIGNTDLLVLAGDIFDLWFTWKTVMIKHYFPLLKILADLKEHGCRLVYLSGNHDFWLEGFLEEYIGFEVYSDSFNEVIDGKNLFVAHGDYYTKNDYRYHFFRRLIRQKWVMTLFKWLHPDIGLAIGNKMSRSSRERKDNPSILELKEKGLESFAEKMSLKYDYIIMGHTHRPKEIKMQKGIYFNAGDWIAHNSYVEIVDGIAHLLRSTATNLNDKDTKEIYNKKRGI